MALRQKPRVSRSSWETTKSQGQILKRALFHTQLPELDVLNSQTVLLFIFLESRHRPLEVGASFWLVFL
jgi:hypothetical protein